ncbi:MAG: ATP synthase F0 subunit A [Bacteroidetes bacterium]|nr:MAG: ATP synthase F0 subunit A [Bacteroidota bacterium]
MRIFESIQSHFIRRILLIIFTFGLTISGVFAMADPENTHEETEELNVGELIFEHVLDAHDWHILTWKGHHVSIPLPVILYSPGKGLEVFMSSQFHHGHSGYNGYKLEDGNIVAEDGSAFYDLSITKTVAAIMISILLLCVVLITVGNAYSRNKGQAPKGIQSVIEPLVIFIRDDIAKPSIGEDYFRYMPFLLTAFFFIWINNMMGLIPIFPGGANVTGNIAVTLVLALFTFVITAINTNKQYWIHLFNMPGVPWWLKFPIPLMPIIEIFGVFSKPFVLMLRLFANITAGHMIILVFVSMIFIFGNMNMWVGYGTAVVSTLFSAAMLLLEILVAFLQAYVFTLLSAIYFGMAKVEEHH